MNFSIKFSLRQEAPKHIERFNLPDPDAWRDKSSSSENDAGIIAELSYEGFPSRFLDSAEIAPFLKLVTSYLDTADSSLKFMRTGLEYSGILTRHSNDTKTLFIAGLLSEELKPFIHPLSAF